MEPILAQWDGAAFIPARRHVKALDAQLVVGENYVLDVAMMRNMAQHRAYFANLKTVWQTLPEGLAESMPTIEAMRKRALILTGYAHETMRVFDTHEDAVKAASFVAALDEFAIVEVKDNVLRAWRAKSQSVADMGAEEFKASCAAVETFLARLIETTREQLQIAAGRDAA